MKQKWPAILRHRWATPRYKRSNIKHERWHPPHLYETGRVSHCVKCGASKFIALYSSAYPYTLFRPRGGIFTLVRKQKDGTGGTPACQGLPADYDTPIGA